METKGTLYIVATPIGNLGDITLRAVETLKSVDVIAAEDTRHTAKLLSHLDIHKEVVSFHEHSSEREAERLLGMLEDGRSMALVSDAGMPMISDPGYVLVRKAIDADVPVTVLPGPSAAAAAVAVSGIDCRQFLFAGFLPSKQVQRRRELVRLAAADMPIVLYESPNRVLDLLEDISAVIDPETPVSVARELTKIHEEVLRGHCDDVLSELSAREMLKGEYVIIADAHRNIREMEDDELREALAGFIAEGMSRKAAVDFAASLYGVPKKRVYKISLDMGM
ncbi:MAG: 16S rRNA (cytidine(1402)-2'-O)-methyltransferase [Clostridia bacterium]|nr:16S rRNA (cytidine(1402)-2'-O)-methyltransferase [Clostridia bacterium]